VPSRHPITGWARRQRHLLIGVLNTEIEMERVEQWPAVGPNPPCIFHRHDVNEDLMNHTTPWLYGRNLWMTTLGEAWPLRSTSSTMSHTSSGMVIGSIVHARSSKTSVDSHLLDDSSMK
jgi:hypothetical protein